MNYFSFSVREQFDLTDEAWEEKIITWWKHYKDTDMEEAKLEYLKLAQDLEMYGVTYFPIKKNTTELWLGVDSLGLTIYEKDNK